MVELDDLAWCGRAASLRHEGADQIVSEGTALRHGAHTDGIAAVGLDFYVLLSGRDQQAAVVV